MANATNTVAIFNGANLDQLGRREPHIYGHHTLKDVEQRCAATALELGFSIDFRQTNHEGTLLEWLHQAGSSSVGLILNGAGWTHTSVALHDAVKIYPHPVIEVHLSNPHARDAFRHVSYLSSIAKGTISGFGIDSYHLAILAMAKLVK